MHSKFKAKNTPDCRFCKQATETTAHILQQCPSLSTLRCDINYGTSQPHWIKNWRGPWTIWRGQFDNPVHMKRRCQSDVCLPPRTRKKKKKKDATGVIQGYSLFNCLCYEYGSWCDLGTNGSRTNVSQSHKMSSAEVWANPRKSSLLRKRCRILQSIMNSFRDEAIVWQIQLNFRLNFRIFLDMKPFLQ